MTLALAAALQADDNAEDAGMHPDRRVTCWTCQYWAGPGHAHPFLPSPPRLIS